MNNKTSFLQKLSSNPIIQSLVFYISGSWLLMEMLNFIIDKYDLSERILDILLLILVCGLPVFVLLVWYLSRRAGSVNGKKDSTSESQAEVRQLHSKLKVGTRWWVISVLILIVLILSVSFRLIFHSIKTNWTQNEAIPEIERLWNNNEYSAAFGLYNKARKYIRDEKVNLDLEKSLIQKLSIITEPPGAEIFIKEYAATDDKWQSLGSTPIDSLEMPYRVFYQCRIIKEGYEPVLAVFSSSQGMFSRKLFRKGEIPQGMVHVNGLMEDQYADHLNDSQDFFIDRYEVTNKQFKAFIDDNGYRDRSFWKHKFIHNGNPISWEEAMSFFVDRTGRPGPADWIAGDYPKGMDKYPVNGISWYEAAAYAEYIGKELPTLMHWYSAMGKHIYHFNRSFPALLTPASNLIENHPVEVGAYRGIGCFGTYDMAGNVREWCWNPIRDGKLVIGAAWNDSYYLYFTPDQAPLFDRSQKNGFRCVINPNRESLDETVFGPVPTVHKRDFLSETPVSDEVFNIYRNQFLYDKKDLNAVIESRDEEAEEWVLEKISFEAAYGNERVYAYLYLPKKGNPPFQTMVSFPGDGALIQHSFAESTYNKRLTFMASNNIAVLHPVYYETWDRCQSMNDSLDNPKENHTFTEHLVKWVKDFRRSIDYLETREEIDNNKIGYFGYSWGGMMGAIIPAVEDRLKLCVLGVPGMYSYNKALPEADIINYITRVNIPVLMMDGRYDNLQVYDKDVYPMYKLFGTPEKDKLLKLYDTGHYLPQTQLIRETLAWLEKYWGPPL